MWLSAAVKKKFSNPKMLLSERLSASKFSFIVSSLLFFVNYFLVSAQFGAKDFLIFILPFTYIAFVLSFIFYTYYIIKNKLFWKLNTAIFLILLVILLLIWTVLSISFILPESMIPDLV